jgi:hypothetical protein
MPNLAILRERFDSPLLAAIQRSNAMKIEREARRHVVAALR